MLESTYPLYLANTPKTPNTDLSVTDKYSGEEVCRVPLADAAMLDEAIASAHDARLAFARTPSHVRRDVLRHCVTRFRERRDELAHSLCVEAGKPIADAEGEVDRLVETFEIASELVMRDSGSVLTLDSSPRTERYRAMVRRVPVGVCSFITPFNFPLNLVAHKVAPAIACACPFVLKPTRRTPIGALLIGGVLAETDLPKGTFSILPMNSEDSDALVTDERVRLLSFTGSDSVGKMLAERATMKTVVLELGGNAACVVDEGTDTDDCVSRLVHGGYYQSGQSCISVQRVLVHESRYDDLKAALAAKVSTLRAGDPKDRDTFIGPMISEDAAESLEGKINEAVEAGAGVVVGGERRGAMFPPTLLENVRPDLAIAAEEAFGPVVILSSFADFDEALDRVNDSRFGLQAGVFTNDLRRMHRAWDRLEVGGVVINDVPSFRADAMPYGGVKDSGLGREGVASSIEHMTEPRVLVVRDV
ncbi:MAG: aldehyde dehydrogenase family protein [Phycisphaerales bacterium JB040]